MSRSLFAMTLALTALVLAAGLVADARRSPAVAQEAGASAKIGYVDIFDVLQGYDSYKDKDAALKESYKTKLDELKREKEFLENEAKTLELLDPDSPEYRAKSRELQEGMYRVRFKLELENKELQLQMRRNIRDAYRTILEELAALARRQGYQLILRQDPGVEALDEAGANPEEYFAGRRILFHSEARDVTQDLIRALNR